MPRQRKASTQDHRLLRVLNESGAFMLGQGDHNRQRPQAAQNIVNAISACPQEFSFAVNPRE